MLWSSFGVLVVCLVTLVSSSTWMDGDIRLVGGPRRYMGTVVVYHNGKWGAICDDQWDVKDATVVCRQLGYTFALRATTQSEYGPGNKRLWLSQVGCTGREKRLIECPLLGFDDSTRDKCLGRYRSAGVICSAAISTTTFKSLLPVQKINVTETATTVKYETISTSAKVTKRRYKQNDWNIMKSRGAKKTTNILWTPPETSTLTAMIEDTTMMPEVPLYMVQNETESSTHISSMKDSTLQTNTSITHSNSSLSHLLSNVQVENVESSGNARTQENESHSIIHKEKYSTDNAVSNNSLQDANVSLLPCNMSSENKNTEGCEVYFADEPRFENIEARLNGGRYNWEGHLQVRINNGIWGTVCSDHWTLREAMVACNQFGEYGKAKQALLTNYFGGTDVPKTVYRMECIGRESTLASCNFTLTDKEHTCSKKTSVAGVVCSQHLPDLVPNLKDIENSIRLQDQPLYYLRCAMEENCLASSAYVIKNTSLTWRNSMRRLLRFSTVVHNRGLADFRPYRPRGQWEWHACHMHYHSMEVFAHYDIIDAQGRRLAEGSKASFCLEDTTCDNGVVPQYNCRGFADQGLSVNCSDNYMYDIDCQWIDISDIKPGEYTFLMAVNPTMLVAESNFDNNVVNCRLYYNGYFASVKNCHYHSLLDYREGKTVLF